MAFRILIDGEEVNSVDERVTRVSIMTSRGVAAEFGIADEGAIDIRLIKAVPGGPRRLDDIEREAAQEERDRVGDQPVGAPDTGVPKELTTTQTGETVTRPPERDLTEGLEADDVDGRTAAVNKHLSGDNETGTDTTLDTSTTLDTGSEEDEEENKSEFDLTAP